MAAPSEREQYSTLEVATDRDLLNQGNGLEVVPPSIPEAYGYYDPAKQGQAATRPENDKLFPTAVQTSIPSSTPAYSTYPEVADGSKTAGAGAAAGAGGSQGAKICGLPRKWFWLALVGAVLVVIAVVVGAVVGTMSSGSKDSASQSSEPPNDSNGDGNGNAGQGSSGSGKAGVYEQSRLASANFTDAYGNDNYLVVYQLKDATLRLSAFNSSKNEWIGSNIINGTNNPILLGTSLAIDTFWQGTNVSCFRLPI